MSLPSEVSGREVIVGGGVHAAVYAATRVATGHPKPVVLEKESTTGGIFARLTNFKMNSANSAGVASVAAGPTRLMPLSESDDLNYLPNSPFQVRGMSGMVEYPYSADMAKAVQKTLDAFAEVYTNAQITFTRSGLCSTADHSYSFGVAKRIIFAGGLAVPDSLPKGAAIMSGYDFLRRPVRELATKKIALVGGGDTAAQIAEYMLGQGIIAPTTPPAQIHWYGGASMPLSKKQWMTGYHARFAPVGRHLPQGKISTTGVLLPYPVLGEVIPTGNTAMVNGQIYDLVVMATGFVPARCPAVASDIFTVGNMFVARYSEDTSGQPKVYRIGTAAALNTSYRPYQSRFSAASEAIYNLAPRTAALAASLP